MPQKSDRRIYINADRSRVVEESDPAATFLLVAAGKDVSDEDIKRYGLKFGKPAVEAEAEAEADDEKAEAAAANKARRAGANKAEQPGDDKAG